MSIWADLIGRRLAEWNNGTKRGEDLAAREGDAKELVECESEMSGLRNNLRGNEQLAEERATAEERRASRDQRTVQYCTV